MSYDHTIFFDNVRDSLFAGSMGQLQVEGMDAILSGWEKHLDDRDPRFLAYMLATAYHETSQEMQPIEEYGKGEGHDYGEPDPETGECYYGRGFVQLTHRGNYARADMEGGWQDDDSCEWHPDNALDLHKAGRIMWFGMSEGWFRSDSKGPQTLDRYFSNTHDDAFEAREIINGDKKTVPSWSNGVSIGNLVKGYHEDFLAALHAARIEIEPAPDPAPPAPRPSPDPEHQRVVDVVIRTPKGVQIAVDVKEKD
jgi:putative chitinase